MKEIWCTLQLIVSFCPEFLNFRTKSALSWFQDFEKKGCVYWIFYLTFWSLEGVSLISNCLFLIWCIEIGGIELLGVDKTNNKGVIWFIQGLGLRGKNTKATDRLGTPSYRLICDMPWRRSGAHVNLLFHLVLSFSTAIPNQSYRDYKTLSISVVCIGFFISLRGA